MWPCIAFQSAVARLPRVCAGLNVHLGVERVELERVVMHRARSPARPDPRYTGPLALICLLPSGSSGPFATPSGRPVAVPGMFQTSQWT